MIVRTAQPSRLSFLLRHRMAFYVVRKDYGHPPELAPQASLGSSQMNLR